MTKLGQDKNNLNYDCLDERPISSTQFSFEGKLLYPNYNWNNTIQYPSQLYEIVAAKNFSISQQKTQTVRFCCGIILKVLSKIMNFEG